MKIDLLKKLGMNYQVPVIPKDVESDDIDFIIVALTKFSHLVAVAEAAKRLVKNTPTDPVGYVHTPPAHIFFDLEEAIRQLESK